MLKRMDILQVKRLKVGISTEHGLFSAVDGIDFTIAKGETLALLGESGCGKSMTALALMQLLPPTARIHSESEIIFEQTNLLDLSEVQLRNIRGHRVAMIFQEPMTSLNPVMTIGKQIAEVIQQHFSLSAKDCHDRVIELLNDVGIPDPKQRYHDYPHQLSGGMKQRIMIAMALAGEPDLLIADEPTTALDVTIQLQILMLLKELQRKTGMAMLFITHDLGVVNLVADNVAVMYAGQIVEFAPAKTFFDKPFHPYGQGLMDALPSLDKRDKKLSIISGAVPDKYEKLLACRFARRCHYAWDDCLKKRPELIQHDNQQVRCHIYDHRYKQKRIDPTVVASTTVEEIKKTANHQELLKVDNLKVHFPIQKGLLKRTVGYVKAVDGVSLALDSGKTVAIVGESGCGKTTMGRAILQLISPNAGTINYQLEDLMACSSKRLHELRRDLQIIFQDPYSSMNPRMMIFDILAEGIRAHNIVAENDIEDFIDKVLEKVGLPVEAKFRYPHQFSGGQRQRVCIARALCVQPQVIICDEPTSALDVSVQAQILNLLRDLQYSDGLAYVFITHNISVVSYIADEVAVMYLGRIVEYGSVQDILTSPKHPYTQALLAAVPDVKAKTFNTELVIKGEQPSPINPPTGCHFHPRCPHAMDICRQAYPPNLQIPGEQQVKCFLYQESQNQGLESIPQKTLIKAR